MKSKYGDKVASGKMMYGTGCCGHKVSHERVQARKEAVMKFRGNHPSRSNLAVPNYF